MAAQINHNIDYLKIIRFLLLDDIYELSRTLSERGIPNSHLDFDDFDKNINKFIPHKTIVLLDLECFEAFEILEKV